MSDERPDPLKHLDDRIVASLQGSMRGLAVEYVEVERARWLKRLHELRDEYPEGARHRRVLDRAIRELGRMSRLT